MQTKLKTGFLFFAIWACIAQHAQSQSNQFGYPSIDILLTDSTTIFRTANADNTKPVVILYFSTTCEHCQNLAKQLVKKKKDLSGLLLIMISIDGVSAIKNFYQQYSLSHLPGLIIGKDYKFTGSRFYSFESFPFCAIYSRQKKFIKSFERDFTPASIISELKKKGEL